MLRQAAKNMWGECLTLMSFNLRDRRRLTNVASTATVLLHLLPSRASSFMATILISMSRNFQCESLYQSLVSRHIESAEQLAIPCDAMALGCSTSLLEATVEFWVPVALLISRRRALISSWSSSTCSTVRDWVWTSSAETLSTNQLAKVAVTVPSSAMPPIMSPTATRRPVVVTGERSPYPTVVIVTTAHHAASAKELMDASAAVFSASYIARAPI